MIPLDIDWVQKSVGGQLVGHGNGSQQPLSGVTTDSRRVQSGDLFVALSGPKFDGHDYVAQAFESGASCALVEKEQGADVPGQKGPCVRVEDTRRALGDLAAKYRQERSLNVIGVTGSCGKTTTKNFLHHVLSPWMETVASPSSYNNDVGVPLTLLQIEKSSEAAIVEMGTNAKGEISRLAEMARPQVGIVTNVYESHLQGLFDLDGVADEKADLLRSLPKTGLAILNSDCPRSSYLRRQTSARVVTVGLGEGADYQGSSLSFHGLGTSFVFRGRRITVPLVGTHFVYNVLTAIAVAEYLGLSAHELAGQFATLPQTPHRLERKCFGDITVFDDTYNANPGSMRAALRAIAGLSTKENRRVAILGDMLELGEQSDALHQEIGRELVRAHVFGLVMTVGASSQWIHTEAHNAGIPAFHFEGVAPLIDRMGELLKPGDWVLVKGSNALGMDRIVHAAARLEPKLGLERSVS